MLAETADCLSSPFTGFLDRGGALPRRAHDPDLAIVTARLHAWGARPPLIVGGAGWQASEAEAGCLGEAIERMMCCPLPGDRSIEASVARWPLDEPPADPAGWVLFSEQQYAQPGFPFRPLRADSVCRWVRFRSVPDGDPVWAPADLAYLFLEPGASHCICPGLSTGLACGRDGQPVLLRALQELIERDAVVGAWWGSYPLEQWDPGGVLRLIGPARERRLLRPNLTYRFFRVRSPYSDHVVLVTLEGEDRVRWCFSAGSACREDRAAAWCKAAVEAVQGRHYVRWLLEQAPPPPGAPASFEQHACYYSLQREALQGTPLARPVPIETEGDGQPESLATLLERLGPQRRPLVRDMTPPPVAQRRLGWRVLRVVAPGIQPLHGDHRLPHLGGPLWGARDLAAWRTIPPHPFP